MSLPALDIRHISKSYGGNCQALKNVSLTLNKGEMVALIGASGAGKSTLLRTIPGLLTTDTTPGSGIFVFGAPMQENGRISSSAKALRARIGVIFQQFNLVPRLSVLTNVCIGRLGQINSLRASFGVFTKTEKRMAIAALERVGIASQALKRSARLSGGQQQRAAIARTLMQGADILIADEPIASLDPVSARRVMDVISDLNQRDGITVLVSLHQVHYAIKYCQRTVALRNGEVVFDGPSSALNQAILKELYDAKTAELFMPGVETEAVPQQTFALSISEF